MWTLRKVSDPDQPKDAAQANPGRHVFPPVEFLFQESIFYTSIYPPETRNVSARMSLHRLIWVDTLCRGHTNIFLNERLISRLVTGT